MRIYIAADHAGFALKKSIATALQADGYEVIDCGAATEIPTDDYPDIVTPCAHRVAGDMGSFGIVIGASGQGEAIAANRVSGIRAVVYYGEAPRTQTDASGNILNLLQSTRAHNDANILSLGARFLSEEEACAAARLWLQTPFGSDERHIRRVQKLA